MRSPDTSTAESASTENRRCYSWAPPYLVPPPEDWRERDKIRRAYFREKLKTAARHLKALKAAQLWHQVWRWPDADLGPGPPPKEGKYGPEGAVEAALAWLAQIVIVPAVENRPHCRCLGAATGAAWRSRRTRW